MPRTITLQLALLFAWTACATRPAPPIAPVNPPPATPTTATPDPASDPAPLEPAPPPAEPAPLAPAGPPKFEVMFKISPDVGPTPPILDITIRSATATQPVPLTAFDDPVCFVHHYLDLEISRPSRKPQPLAQCVVKAWPGADAPLAVGEVRQIKIPLAKLATSWPRGTYGLAIAWNPQNLAAARGEAAAVRASQSQQSGTGFTIASPIKTFRITRGSSVDLPDGVVLRFTGHGHKDVEPGMDSPLIIHGTLARPGGKPDEFSVNLHTEHTRIFRLEDDLVFELVEYAYDDFMKLHYYGKLRPPP